MSDAVKADVLALINAIADWFKAKIDDILALFTLKEKEAE